MKAHREHLAAGDKDGKVKEVRSHLRCFLKFLLDRSFSPSISWWLLRFRAVFWSNFDEMSLGQACQLLVGDGLGKIALAAWGKAARPGEVGETDGGCVREGVAPQHDV